MKRFLLSILITLSLLCSLSYAEDFEINLHQKKLLAMSPAFLEIISSKISSACTSGTYEILWDGTYGLGTEYACRDSGASAVAGTADSGVIINDGGTIKALIDADSEGVYWSMTTPNSLGLAGTIDCQVTTSSSVDNVQILVIENTSLYLVDSMHIYLGNSDGGLYGAYEGNNSGTVSVDSGTNLPTSSTRTVNYTWDETNDIHCAAVTAAGTPASSGDYSCDSETLTTQTHAIDGAEIGEVNYPFTYGGQSVSVFNCHVREGYEGP